MAVGQALGAFELFTGRKADAGAHRRALPPPGRATQFIGHDMSSLDREAIVEASNPLGIEGIEFIEYTTPRPQALGQVLESIGFRPIARHRSREVMLYRQGGMNIVVNAHGVVGRRPTARRRRSPRSRCACAMPARRRRAWSSSAAGRCR